MSYSWSDRKSSKITDKRVVNIEPWIGDTCEAENFKLSYHNNFLIDKLTFLLNKVNNFFTNYTWRTNKKYKFLCFLNFLNYVCIYFLSSSGVIEKLHNKMYIEETTTQKYVTWTSESWKYYWWKINFVLQYLNFSYCFHQFKKCIFCYKT